jgi:hypothetical protein
VLVGVQFMGFVGKRLGGRHSVSSSRFDSVAFGAEAWFLEKARVTIGGSPGKGNTITNCAICTDAGSANRSTIQISHNHIVTQPGF